MACLAPAVREPAAPPPAEKASQVTESELRRRLAEKDNAHKAKVASLEKMLERALDRAKVLEGGNEAMKKEVEKAFSKQEELSQEMANLAFLCVGTVILASLLSGAAALNGLVLGSSVGTSSPMIGAMFCTVWVLISIVIGSVMLVAASYMGIADVLRFII